MRRRARRQELGGGPVEQINRCSSANLALSRLAPGANRMIDAGPNPGRKWRVRGSRGSGASEEGQRDKDRKAGALPILRHHRYPKITLYC